jgi:hypothetical protein
MSANISIMSFVLILLLACARSPETISTKSDSKNHAHPKSEDSSCALAALCDVCKVNVDAVDDDFSGIPRVAKEFYWNWKAPNELGESASNDKITIKYKGFDELSRAFFDITSLPSCGSLKVDGKGTATLKATYTPNADSSCLHDSFTYVLHAVTESNFRGKDEATVNLQFAEDPTESPTEIPNEDPTESPTGTPESFETFSPPMESP